MCVICEIIESGWLSDAICKVDLKLNIYSTFLTIYLKANYFT